MHTVPVKGVGFSSVCEENLAQSAGCSTRTMPLILDPMHDAIIEKTNMTTDPHGPSFAKVSAMAR